MRVGVHGWNCRLLAIPILLLVLLAKLSWGARATQRVQQCRCQASNENVNNKQRIRKPNSRNVFRYNYRTAFVDSDGFWVVEGVRVLPRTHPSCTPTPQVLNFWQSLFNKRHLNDIEEVDIAGDGEEFEIDRDDTTDKRALPYNTERRMAKARNPNAKGTRAKNGKTAKGNREQIPQLPVFPCPPTVPTAVPIPAPSSVVPAPIISVAPAPSIDMITPQPSVSTSPTVSQMPSQSIAPSIPPSLSAQPSERPSLNIIPPSPTAGSPVPSSVPSFSPSGVPSIFRPPSLTAPSSSPSNSPPSSLTVEPSSAPSVIVAPSQPDSAAPSNSPSSFNFTSTTPSEAPSYAPSFTPSASSNSSAPSVSLRPSNSPSTSAPPSTSPAPSPAPTNATTTFPPSPGNTVSTQTIRKNVFRKPNTMAESDVSDSSENQLCTSNIAVSVSIGSNSNPGGYFLNMPVTRALDSLMECLDVTMGKKFVGSRHYWWSRSPLELVFDFQGEIYDLQSTYFWNFRDEDYDVDEIILSFFDSQNRLISSQKFFPRRGLNTEGSYGADVTPERIVLDPLVLDVAIVKVLLTGYSGQLDFLNLMFGASG